MRSRKNALIGALVWWFARRWLTRRAALAVATSTGGAATRRGRIGAVVGGVALVGALAAGFLFWRKRSGKGDVADDASPAATPPSEPAPFPAKPPTDAPPPPAAA